MDRFKEINKRIDNIENLLETISNNHLAHIEKYTKWMIIGGSIILLLVLMQLGVTLGTIT